jgi:acetyl/propionyl-CoA carboxylase alpha subunit
MLRPFFATAVLLCLTIASVKAAEEQNIIVAEGDTLPKVKVGDLIRLSASGPSGKTEITAKIEGPAKLVSTAKVRKFVNGQPLIGAMTKEFLVEAEKKGTATIKISITDVVEKKTKVQEYKLEIE